MLNMIWPAELLNKETGEILEVHSIGVYDDGIEIFVKIGKRVKIAMESDYEIASFDRRIYKINRVTKQIESIIMRVLT